LLGKPTILGDPFGDFGSSLIWDPTHHRRYQGRIYLPALKANFSRCYVQVTFGVPKLRSFQKCSTFSFAEILADCRVSTSFMVSIEMCPYVDLQSKISFCIGFMSSITTEVHAYALPSSRQCPQNGGKSHTKLDVCWSLASLRVWIFDAFRMVQHVLAGAFKDFLSIF